MSAHAVVPVAELMEELIDVIRARKDLAGLPVEEREVVAYTEQLICNNRVDQAAFDALKNWHGVQWLVELTAAANYYSILCGIVNAFEVPAPPDGDKLPT